MNLEEQLRERAERDDYIEMFNLLRTDSVHAGDELSSGIRQSPDLHQYRSRNYVRATFAFIEGGLNAMIIMAYQRHLMMVGFGQPSPFTPSEINELSKKVLPFNDNVERAFRLFSKAFAQELVIPMSGDGWEALQQVKEVRNRLTHPKNLADLEVEADEISQMTSAISWIAKCIEAVADEMRRQDVEQFEDSVSDLIILKFGITKEQGILAVRRMLGRVGGIPRPEQYADSMTVLEEEIASIMTA
jgi:hypothetical protein